MKRRDRLALPALTALLAVVGTAMLFPGSGWLATGPTPPPAATYREAIVGRPSSINPLTARTQVDRDLVALLFRGLVKVGPDGTLAPDLARSWALAADGQSCTFFLGDDDRWHDGRPVSGEDVVFTIGLASGPDYEGPLGAEWRGAEAVIVSPHVVRVSRPTPMGGLLRLATLPILPRHLLEDVAVTDLADSPFSARPVGSGAFRLIEIDSRHAVLDRVAPMQSPQSAGASPSESPSGSAPSPGASGNGADGRPIETLEMRFFETEAEAAQAFVADEVDAVGGVHPGTAGPLAGHSGTRLGRYHWANLTAVVLNQRQTYPEFGAVGVRRALLAGIDRPAVLTRLLGGRGSVADAPLPVWSSWYQAAAVKAVPYAGPEASSGLASAGWTRGRDGWMLPGQDQPYVIRLLTLDEEANTTVFRVAEQVAADWRAMGLQVSLVPASVGEYRRALGSGQFQAAVVEYRLGLDPDLSALLLSSQIAPAGANLSGVSDATLDRLLKTVRTTAAEKERRAAVSELETHVTSNVLMLPVCFTDYVFAVSGRVQDRSETQIADPSDRYWDVLDWRLAGAG